MPLPVPLAGGRTVIHESLLTAVQDRWRNVYEQEDIQDLRLAPIATPSSPFAKVATSPVSRTSSWVFSTSTSPRKQEPIPYQQSQGLPVSNLPTRRRAGHDIGNSYRSAIFYLTEEQRAVAEDTIADVDASGLWPGKVVTEVTPAGPFWEAEPEHQDYLERYPSGYTCHFVRPNWKLPRRSASTLSE